MSFLKSIRQTLGLDIEQPEYKVLQKIDENTEIRQYPPSKWVCTSIELKAEDMRQQSSGMFYKLFNYISGQNDNNQKIAMTSPVTFDYKSAELINPNTKCNMSMRFYVPKEFQNTTPKPTASDAFLTEDPETTFAVIRFGGYATMNDYLKYRDILIQKLGSEEAKNYDTVNMMAAGYDPPFKPIGRTNEVWLRRVQNA